MDSANGEVVHRVSKRAGHPGFLRLPGGDRRATNGHAVMFFAVNVEGGAWKFETTGSSIGRKMPATATVRLHRRNDLTRLSADVRLRVASTGLQPNPDTQDMRSKAARQPLARQSTFDAVFAISAPTPR